MGIAQKAPTRANRTLRTESRHATMNDGGYILLYTLLILTLFAFLLTSVLSSGIREVSINDAELGSARAIFAADAGIECALYWLKTSTTNVFSTNKGGLPYLGRTGTDVYCSTNAANMYYSTDNVSGVSYNPVKCHSSTSEFNFQMRLENNTCVDVTVEVSQNSTDDRICNYLIKSTGIDNANCALTDPFTVTRTRWATP